MLAPFHLSSEPNMLVFVTSLRHPLNSSSYDRIEQLLERTLASVCAQTSERFRVIVVCHRIPKIRYDERHVEFVLVDFAPPSAVQGPRTGIQAVRRDKGSKLLVGLLEARKYAPTHAMIFDSDDRVSNRIAEYVERHPDENGWYSYHGYTYAEGGSMIKKKENFHLLCGTSHILRYDALELDETGIDSKDQEQLMKRFGERFIKHVLGCHMTTAAYFQSLDVPLKPLPFPGAVWVLNTGENHSGSGAITFGRPLSPELMREFTIEGRTAGTGEWMRENARAVMRRLKLLPNGA
jgi:hypothetical protein